jgi:predicted DNA-binding transcriptional regulator AlpA
MGTEYDIRIIGPVVLINLCELQWVPISRSSLWTMIHDGHFPPPLRLSGRIAIWKMADVQ